MELPAGLSMLNFLEVNFLHLTINFFITKTRKQERKEKFRAHAAQAPALRVPIFVFSLFNPL
jgi:hypothetical protein